MTISEWTVLRCDCKGDLFEPIVRLKYKKEGGTTSEPAGHKCVACGAVVDNAYMIFLIENQKKRDEAGRLLAEAAVAEAQTKKPERPQAAPAGR